MILAVEELGIENFAKLPAKARVARQVVPDPRGGSAPARCSLPGASVMFTYGVRLQTLKEATAVVAEVLGVSFELHDSSFRGGDYFLADVPEGTIYIQSNLDILDDELFEESWPRDQHLLYFDGLDDDNWTRWVKLLTPLEASEVVVFLRRARY